MPQSLVVFALSVFILGLDNSGGSMLYLHLAVMALVCVGTIVVAIRFFGKSDRRMVSVVMAALPLFFLGVLCQFLLSANGSPMIEWILPAFSVMVVGVTCRSDQVFRRFRNVMVVVAILLCGSFMTIVNTDEYTGNPQFRTQITNAKQVGQIRSIADRLQQDHAEDTELPAGPVGKVLVTKVDREWHTCFSGIYRVRKQPEEVWFSGGSVDNARDSLVIKDSQRAHGESRGLTNGKLRSYDRGRKD